ncbi:MAG: DUF2809 domain-containing protein [Bradyrhizobium sp.]|nr:DUF2809 domain-containing protein [Bradyrhizobium sp.]
MVPPLEPLLRANQPNGSRFRAGTNTPQEESLAKEGSTGDQGAIDLRTKSLLSLAIALIIIVCGLALRRYGFQIGLPAFIVKYGGSLLWATMVFFLVSATLPRLDRRDAALIAAAVAILVELFRLVHTPWLDSFRLTTAGALLLGRIFSPWNMVAYGIGILLGVALDWLTFAKFVPRGTQSAS